MGGYGSGPARDYHYYLNVQVIYEGLAGYEKNTTAPPSSLFGTLMMLKAACINNACYIDR